METKKTISLGAKGRSRFTEEGSAFDFKITAVGDRLLVGDFSADIFMVLGITRQSNHFNVTYNVTFCFIKIMNEILMLLHEHIFTDFKLFFRSNNLLCSSSICKLTPSDGLGSQCNVVISSFVASFTGRRKGRT